MTQWFEDESFWVDTYPFMFSSSRIAAEEEEVDQIMALVGARPQAVLDLCCGPGRYAVPLARRGFHVTGVDRTAFFLNKARELATVENVDVSWVQDDIRTFLQPNAFDLVLSMFTSFGYFDDKEEDLTVLRNILGSLRPGGVLVMDVMGKKQLAQAFKSTASRKLADGSVILRRHEVFDEWTRIRNEWTIIRGDTVRIYTFHHTIYSGQELKDRLTAVGFGDVRLYGSIDGAPYDRQAERLIVVGSKPAP